MGSKHHFFRAAVSSLAGLGLALWALGAAAQVAPVVQQQRLVELGRSAVRVDDSAALVLNPAYVAFLPGSELRWTGTYLNEDVVVPWQGHAFDLAFRLPFSLATGFRLDLVDPPRAAEVGAKPDYQWFTWGLALRTSESSSIGFS